MGIFFCEFDAFSVLKYAFDLEMMANVVMGEGCVAVTVACVRSAQAAMGRLPVRGGSEHRAAAATRRGKT